MTIETKQIKIVLDSLDFYIQLQYEFVTDIRPRKHIHCSAHLITRRMPLRGVLTVMGYR